KNFIAVTPKLRNIWIKWQKIPAKESLKHNKNLKRDKIKLAVLFTPFTYFSQLYFAP
ncbi:MAG: hypothetical protein ACJAS1_006658, partial [Oleiphilaceae bacterium]